MIKDPSQIIYDELFKLCVGLGVDTYNGLPNKDAPYPFVSMGESFDQGTEFKQSTALSGSLQQTIHIFGLADNRKQVTDIIHDIKLGTRFLKSPNFTVQNIHSTTQNENPDNSKPLLHAVMTIDCFYFV